MRLKLAFLIPLTIILGYLMILRINTNNSPQLSQSICDQVVNEQQKNEVIITNKEPSPVNFDKSPWAQNYRTTITDQASKGANFAGHYTFVSWGCGTDCITFTLIDSDTGEIIINPSITKLNAHPSFSIDSNLLVFNSKEGLEDVKGMTREQITSKYNFIDRLGREYYELTETDTDRPFLNHICTENILDGIYSVSLN